MKLQTLIMIHPATTPVPQYAIESAISTTTLESAKIMEESELDRTQGVYSFVTDLGHELDNAEGGTDTYCRLLNLWDSVKTYYPDTIDSVLQARYEYFHDC